MISNQWIVPRRQPVHDDLVEIKEKIEISDFIWYFHVTQWTFSLTFMILSCQVPFRQRKEYSPSLFTSYQVKQAFHSNTVWYQWHDTPLHRKVVRFPTVVVAGNLKWTIFWFQVFIATKTIDHVCKIPCLPLSFLFLMWTTLNIKVFLTKKRAKYISKGTLDIDCERDSPVGLGATLGDGQKIKNHFYSFRDFCGKSR